MTQQLLPETPEKTQQHVEGSENSPDSAPSFQGGLHPIAQLQRTLGNRRVAQLIQAKRLTPEGKIIGLQRKLTVGAADDHYEQEADRVARQVMSTPDAVATNSMQRALSLEEDKDKMLQTKPLAASITPLMQRQMVNNEEPEDKDKLVQAKFLTGTSKESLQRQPETDDKEKEPIQAKSAGSISDSFDAGDDVETQVSQSKGRGSPLPDPMRAYMEPRFGVDFSQVRVHTGSDALQMNRDVGAQAFTHGSDIYFGEGSSPSNLELTAHELTHVVQQTGGMPLQTKKQEQPVAPLALKHLSNGVVLRAPKASTFCPTCAANQEETVQRQAHQEGGAPSERGKSPLKFLLTDHGVSGSAQPLPFYDQIQVSFGRHSVGSIEAHVGAAASQASEALGARAYATGNAVAFAGSPDLHTAAHEAAHVIQQRAGVHLKDGFGEAGDVYERHADAVADRVVRGESAESLLDHYKGEGGSGGVQFSLISSTPVPGAGNFTINMVTRPAAAPGGVNQLDGFLQFTPQVGALNSNTIAFWQIVKLTNAGDPNTDAPVGTLSPQAAPRGALGQFGLSTADNPAAGVVGGFFTDVHHIPALHAPGTAQTPRNRFEPTPAGGTPAAGITPGPRGGVGGVFGLTPNGATPGFKRSDDPSDIRSAAMYDTPGSGGDLDFEFQSVARGEDTQVDYGSINWGFGTRRATGVINEHVNVTPGSSATFANAIERHRDFYVHEPVTIYFAFDRDNVDAAQDVKIALLAGYLGRNPAVQMTLDGFADQIGNVAYNVALSQRRVNNVRAAILGHFPATHVAANTVVPDGGHGISTAATDATSEQPADTGDQPGGVAATGADQSREANRQFNRRVTITFSHPPGTGPAAPGGVGNPAPPAPAPAGP